MKRTKQNTLITSAERVEPYKFRPEQLRTLDDQNDWSYSASALFDWLRTQVTQEQLWNIANADFSNEADSNFTALKDLCNSGLIPKQLDWALYEVLALTRWSTGENIDHLERALCCTLLCLSGGENSRGDLNINAPILLESCFALGGEAPHGVKLFFAWLGHSSSEYDCDLDQPLALLALFVARAASSPEDPRLKLLAENLLEHLTRPQKHLGLGYNYNELQSEINYSMKTELWHELFARILMPLRDKANHFTELLQAIMV